MSVGLVESFIDLLIRRMRVPIKNVFLNGLIKEDRLLSYISNL
jgi:hypothetical protein